MLLRSALSCFFFASSALALVHGMDSSTLVSVATYSKALGEGFVKAIPRGYEEACSVGGRVDPNFVASYHNARAAGFTRIDTYWFPCTGSGNRCKPYTVQIAELIATIEAHHMSIGTIWIDFENDPSCGTVGVFFFFLSIMTSFLTAHVLFHDLITVELRLRRQPSPGSTDH
jgi:hypothetical protein